jgi:hypothetical protein
MGRFISYRLSAGELTSGGIMFKAIYIALSLLLHEMSEYKATIRTQGSHGDTQPKSSNSYVKRRHPIHVSGRFATALETAKTLGVSRSRANALINLAKRSIAVGLAAKRTTVGPLVEVSSNRSRTKAAASRAKNRLLSDSVVIAAKNKTSSTHGEFTVKKLKVKR